MEGDKGGTAGSSRWNPTKEQISMLEGLYEQGVRTPSAEQIQQITGRLRAYGHIEGKNVFYWFQNHKARQRQKQKQESMAYFNRLYHRTTRFLYPPSCSNVGIGPYYLQQAEAVSYPQSQHALFQTGCRTKQRFSHRSDKTTKMYDSGRFDRFSHNDRRNTLSEIRSNFQFDHENSDDPNRKTLPLFPLQPMRVSSGSSATASMEDSDSTPTSSSLETCNFHQPFFDFFPASNES